jgi:hypothetical protein
MKNDTLGTVLVATCDCQTRANTGCRLAAEVIIRGIDESVIHDALCSKVHSKGCRINSQGNSKIAAKSVT